MSLLIIIWTTPLGVKSESTYRHFVRGSDILKLCPALLGIEYKGNWVIGMYTGTRVAFGHQFCVLFWPIWPCLL